jgi:hypothetical protein
MRRIKGAMRCRRKPRSRNAQHGFDDRGDPEISLCDRATHPVARRASVCEGFRPTLAPIRVRQTRRRWGQRA